MSGDRVLRHQPEFTREPEYDVPPLPAPDAAGIEAALAAGLAAHREGALTCYDHPPTPDHPAWCCECGAHELLVSHRAHVAAALLPVVTQAQAEALREAADACSNIAFGCNEDVQDWLRARADEGGAR